VQSATHELVQSSSHLDRNASMWQSFHAAGSSVGDERASRAVRAVARRIAGRASFAARP